MNNYRTIERMRRYEGAETRTMFGACLGMAGSIIVTYFLLELQSEMWKISLLFLPFFITMYTICYNTRKRIRNNRKQLEHETRSKK